MATMRLVPSSYTLSNTSYLSVSNASNMYNNTDNTTYATVTNSRSSTTSYYIYLQGFNFDSIPSGATINSFTIKIKIRESGATTSTSYRMYLANGTSTASDYASTMPSTTAATITFDNVSSTWDTISGYGSNFGIRIDAKRASRNTTSYLYIYGAEIEVDYTLSQHTITSTITNGTMVSDNPLTINDGEDAVIMFNGNGNYEFQSMTINGVSVSPTENSSYTKGKAVTTVTPTYSTNYSTYSSYAFSNCHDGSTSTYFWSSEAQATGKYVLISFDAAIDLTSFSTYSSNSTDCPGSNNVLQISSDGGTNWTTIGTFTGSTTCDFTNLTATNINAIRIYANSDIDNWLVLNEITMEYTLHSTPLNYQYSYTIKTVTEDQTIVIVFGDSKQLYVKINGTWTAIKETYQKVDGIWTIMTFDPTDTSQKLKYTGHIEVTS